MSRAKALTDQLLTFSKGGLPVKETLNLKQLVDTVVPFNLSGSNVKPVITCPDDLWLVSVDRNQIQQVIGNIIINAKHAMPDGGELHITLANATVQKDDLPNLTKERYIKITFTDCGHGIEPEILERIFDPYFTTKQSGSGLGLAMVYSIIQKHEGEIRVTSQPGQGTTFTIYLPAADVQEQPVQHFSSISRARHKAARILIMDDEAMICELAEDLLEGEGYTVESVENGRLALERYSQALKDGAAFDLVILDLTIPGEVGGKEVIKQILALHPQAKVIVSSGYADDPVIANYVDYGFKGLVKKPYELNTLVNTVNEVLAEDPI